MSITTANSSAYLIEGGIALLITFALYQFVRFWRASSSVLASVQRARAILEAKGDRRALPETFETLDEEMGALGIIGAPWRRFSATLLIPTQPSRPIHQTVMAERFFNSSLLEQAGLNTRFQLAMPNILVGGGLLLTFGGLIWALHAAAASVGAADIAKSREGLRDLLSYYATPQPN